MYISLHAVFPIPLILHYFIITVLWCFPFCGVLCSSVTSFVLGPNILLSTLFMPIAWPQDCICKLKSCIIFWSNITQHQEQRLCHFAQWWDVYHPVSSKETVAQLWNLKHPSTRRLRVALHIRPSWAGHILFCVWQPQVVWNKTVSDNYIYIIVLLHILAFVESLHQAFKKHIKNGYLYTTL